MDYCANKITIKQYKMIAH